MKETNCFVDLKTRLNNQIVDLLEKPVMHFFQLKLYFSLIVFPILELDLRGLRVLRICEQRTSKKLP